MRALARPYFVLNSTLKVTVFKPWLLYFRAPCCCVLSVTHMSNSSCMHRIVITECVIMKELAFGWPLLVEPSWNVMAHAQKPDFVFRRNGRVHLNRRGRQFSRLLTAEVCASAVVMLDTPSSEVVWRVLATHSIRQFPVHFPSGASLCTITFSTGVYNFCAKFCESMLCKKSETVRSLLIS